MLLALPPGSPFPQISSTHTDVWVEFWNIQWASWIEDALSGGSSSTSGWPTSFTLHGRIIEEEGDGLEIRMAGSPSLALVIPTGSKWLLGNKFYHVTDDIIIGEIPPDFTGWIVPTVTYDSNAEIDVWSFTSYVTRPAYGAGVAAKIVSSSDQVDSIIVTEAETDVIPTLPLILGRIRSAGGGGGGGGAVYLRDLKYSPSDPRNAQLVIEEKIAAAIISAVDQSATGGIRLAPSDTEQVWELCLGLVRAIREIAPDTLRFVNVGSARPGLQGTEAEGDTEIFDLGGTLPAAPLQRNYDSR